MTVAQNSRFGHDRRVSRGGRDGTPREGNHPSALLAEGPNAMLSPQPSLGLDLSVAQLPGRMRRGLSVFHEITGLTAVASLEALHPGSAQRSALAPPVHPRCARRLRSVRAAPCRQQWFTHVRSGRRSPAVHSHTCPIGLRCSCVPLRIGGRLVGAVKLVVGPETSKQAFSAATSVLALVVSEISQDALISELSGEVEVLREAVAEFRRIHSRAPAAFRKPDTPAPTPVPSASEHRNRRLVESALAHLHRQYRAQALSLTAVAEALGCNPRYLTTRFTKIVGERMHAYLIRLRVAHACRLLMETRVPIKEVAYASGFRGNGGLARAFRRHVGVSPGEYRRIFAGR